MVTRCTPLLLLSLLAAPAHGEPVPVVEVRTDDTVITQSCRVVIVGDRIVDANGDGVIHIVGAGAVVDFADQRLNGARAGAEADGFVGFGIRVLAKDVTVRGAKVSGFKAGIWATDADGLVVEGCDVSGNFRQRLRSTPAAEDLSDWLNPYDNERNEWLHRYGAGIYVEGSAGVTVRNNRARRGQNGLCLRDVRSSRIYDNDFSFLSGWGIALYRSSGNVVSRNSCDFCIRGYSHGVYSRGQDSAGILVFEQCHDNVFAYNSATHGGDGFFGNAGKVALRGEVSEARIGNNRNLVFANDFSYAAAIGIEMTFSFDNLFAHNTLIGGNYGVWGGYSSDTRVIGNTVAGNHIAGVAVEHGSGWIIDQNTFRENRRGVELWWDDDADLLATPWARFNSTASKDHRIVGNRFTRDRVGVELRRTTGVVVEGNTWDDVPRRSLATDESTQVEGTTTLKAWDPESEPRLRDLPGERKAVGARREWAGRESIVVTEWGPYDGASPHLRRLDASDPATHRYELLGSADVLSVHAEGRVDVRVDGRTVRVTAADAEESALLPYVLTVCVSAATLRRSAVLCTADWDVRVFSYRTDPREDLAAWRREAAESPVRFSTPQLRLVYGMKGPSQLAITGREGSDAALPQDRFGTIATSRLRVAPGRWRLSVASDDGVRVWVDGKRVLDDWTHHAPRTGTVELTFEEERDVELRVEHFELDGYALLSLDLDLVE